MNASALLIVAAILVVRGANGFVPQHRRRTRLLFGSRPRAATRLMAATLARKPSQVQDLDGPTPTTAANTMEEIDPATIPELHDIRTLSEIPGPVPHQPWRKGDTAGCEAPIAADWRREAESVMEKAVAVVGGTVLDITWYLTAVVVTLDEHNLPEDLIKSRGPEIDIQAPTDALFADPNDANPEEIWDDEDGVMYQHMSAQEQEQARQRQRIMYASRDDDSKDETHIPDAEVNNDESLFMNDEYRPEVALHVAREAQKLAEEAERDINVEQHLMVNTPGLSLVAQAILDALQDVEDELHILSRHELILTSPGPPDVLETQRQFDAYRGERVMVETNDPWQSNRTLKGRLVDRNAMDVYINKQGRLVTIPLNFVKCVRLPQPAGATAAVNGAGGGGGGGGAGAAAAAAARAGADEMDDDAAGEADDDDDE